MRAGAPVKAGKAPAQGARVPRGHVVERHADAMADAALSRGGLREGFRLGPPRAGSGSGPPGHELSNAGAPMTPALRGFFEARFDRYFGDVRIHADARAAAAANRLGARAFAAGNHIAFARGAFAPQTPAGMKLIAHELAHVAQQQDADERFLALSPEDWINSSRPLPTAYTELVLEADALAAWIARQVGPSADAVAAQAVLDLMRAEIARHDAEAGRGAEQGRARARPGPAASEAAELPARYPRALLENTTVVYADQAEMRAEYDLIMQWLRRRDIGGQQRSVLEAARRSLQPQLLGDRQQALARQLASRIAQALSPTDADAAALLVQTVQRIADILPDPSDPTRFYLRYGREDVPISRAQRDGLIASAREQLAIALGQANTQADLAEDNFRSHQRLNDDHMFIWAAAWVLAGGVDNPVNALARQRAIVKREAARAQAALAAGDLLEAARAVAAQGEAAQAMGRLASAFVSGFIGGAKRTELGLTITRDVSFAIAGSIAAAYAAPYLAGVGTGLGLGVPVATGASRVLAPFALAGVGAVLRGGAAAGGVLLQGGTREQAEREGGAEGRRGGREFFVAGLGAVGGDVVGRALGVGGPLGFQLARRAGAHLATGFGTGTVDRLMSGEGPGDVLRGGGLNAALALPGALLPGGGGLTRQAAGAGIAMGSAYFGARHAAGPYASEAERDEAAWRAVMMAGATHLATASAGRVDPVLRTTVAQRAQAHGVRTGRYAVETARAGAFGIRMGLGDLGPRPSPALTELSSAPAAPRSHAGAPPDLSGMTPVRTPYYRALHETRAFAPRRTGPSAYRRAHADREDARFASPQYETGHAFLLGQRMHMTIQGDSTSVRYNSRLMSAAARLRKSESIDAITLSHSHPPQKTFNLTRWPSVTDMMTAYTQWFRLNDYQDARGRPPTTLKSTIDVDTPGGRGKTAYGIEAPNGRCFIELAIAPHKREPRRYFDRWKDFKLALDEATRTVHPVDDDKNTGAPADEEITRPDIRRPR